MKPARNLATLILGATLLLLPAHGSLLADQIKAPVVSAGTVTTTNGSLLNVGQTAIGNASSRTHMMNAGVIPAILSLRGPCGCTLELDARFVNGAVTLDFLLGDDVASTSHLWLIAQGQVFPVWAVPLPEVCPPVAFDLSFPLPCVGTVWFVTVLDDGRVDLCFDLVSVETCPTSVVRDPSQKAGGSVPDGGPPGLNVPRRRPEERHARRLPARNANVDIAKIVGKGTARDVTRIQTLVDLLGADVEAGLEPPDPLIVSPRFADFDDNGIVDLTDLLSVLTATGRCAECPEDLDHSGDVGLQDVSAVLAVWGPYE